MAVMPMIYLGILQLFYLVYAYAWQLLAGVGLVGPPERVNEPKRIMSSLARAQAQRGRDIKG